MPLDQGEELNEFDDVVLARAVECEGRCIPVGSVGTILDISPSGQSFEIEFVKPFHCVATVWMTDIATKLHDPPG